MVRVHQLVHYRDEDAREIATLFFCEFVAAVHLLETKLRNITGTAEALISALEWVYALGDVSQGIFLGLFTRTVMCAVCAFRSAFIPAMIYLRRDS